MIGSIALAEGEAMNDKIENLQDPFREAREAVGVMGCPFQGETVPMILRHADVRAAAKDWKTFSSDAPFRVPIPSEEEVRSTRQYPIETDPPEHKEYRSIVEPFFQRSKQPEVIARVEELVEGVIDAGLAENSVEVVNEISLPIQSRALTYLLNVPESEAETYIRWGIHVFEVDGGPAKNGNELEGYLSAQFERAVVTPSDDFFSALASAEFQGRKLSREEMMGFANLAFAGGRHTIIHSISSILAHFAESPDGLDFLREDPKRIVHAAEEFFRVFMPLTHIGRVCPVATDVHGVRVEEDGRVSLAWASANFDKMVFDEPEKIQLDRKPNPHVSFGFGPHLCLGAPHARLIVRTLLRALAEKVGKITLLDSEPIIEQEATFERANGYRALTVKLERV
jgi:cytochrome P450